ncbi:MAG TPA: Nif3-like dinuclear metal center hexameric protein [Lachnospiraceae bacterium]|nr:Nif3-like dinuclear metal center hexameric protein [Lachnospiraceae bacterium]
MRCKELIHILEELSPKNFAESWDNVGLLLGDKEQEVHSIMVALDATGDVIEQAIDSKCDMLITHHPLIFSSMKKITNDNFIGSRIMKLISNRVAYYALHTNFDIAVMARESARMVGLQDTSILEATGTDIGIGRYGTLKQPMTLGEYAEFVKEQFGIDHVRVVGDLDASITTAAVSTGSGEDYISHALEKKVDVLVTGDIRHHAAIDAAERKMNIIDAGHFGTEHFMASWLANYLQDCFERRKEAGIWVTVANEKTPFHIV